MTELLRYGSVCSGIEAVSVATADLPYVPAWFSEIEPFPQAVLRHHFGSNVVAGSPRSRSLPREPGGVWNLGDMTGIRMRTFDRLGIPPVDALVGGTPCQSFSVAGLRKSLADRRGNLALAFVRLAHAIDNLRCHRGLPGLVVLWENVPGVLSTRDNAFGCFLGGLVGSGDAVVSPFERGKWPDAGMVSGPRARAAWRVLDAQYFGLAQRRRRVFVVADFRNGCDPAAVLFERQGMRRNTGASEETRTRIAEGALSRALSRVGGGDDPGANKGAPLVAYGGNDTRGSIDVATALNAKGGTGRSDFESETFVTHSLRADGFDASEDGTGSGIPLVPIAFQTRIERGGRGQPSEIAPALNGADAGATSDMRPVVSVNSGIRRLMPRECERLQGFPDDYTLVPYRGGDAADGPRYKALGNSMAVPNIRWIMARLHRSISHARATADMPHALPALCL